MAHYHLIDVPIHFMAGLNDNLIPAKDCFKHYKVLHRVSPHLATCKPLAGRGHIDFTYGLDTEISHEIFSYAGVTRALTPSVSGNSSPKWDGAGGGSPLPTKMRGGISGYNNRRTSRGGVGGEDGGGAVPAAPGIVLGHNLKVCVLVAQCVHRCMCVYTFIDEWTKMCI